MSHEVYIAPNLADARDEADTNYKGVPYFNFYRADDGDIVLMVWRKPEGCNLMGRDVACIATWNGDDSLAEDLALLDIMLHRYGAEGRNAE